MKKYNEDESKRNWRQENREEKRRKERNIARNGSKTNITKKGCEKWECVIYQFTPVHQHICIIYLFELSRWMLLNGIPPCANTTCRHASIITHKQGYTGHTLSITYTQTTHSCTYTTNCKHALGIYHLHDPSHMHGLYHAAVASSSVLSAGCERRNKKTCSVPRWRAGLACIMPTSPLRTLPLCSKLLSCSLA